MKRKRKNRKKQFVVFGLGRFGGSLVKELFEQGADVMAVDINESRVKEYSQYATYSVCANGIDEQAVKSMGISNFDYAFVSFGNNIEQSILTSLILIELGVPNVIAKAQNDYHQKVLEKIGVHRIIHPEKDMAKRLARYYISDKIIDYIELAKDFSMVELVATKKISNKTIMQLNVRAKYGCNIVGIQRGNNMIVSPSANEKVLENDILIVIGKNDDIKAFETKAF